MRAITAAFNRNKDREGIAEPYFLSQNQKVSAFLVKLFSVSAVNSHRNQISPQRNTTLTPKVF
jgi:hypothetical protein